LKKLEVLSIAILEGTLFIGGSGGMPSQEIFEKYCQENLGAFEAKK